MIEVEWDSFFDIARRLGDMAAGTFVLRVHDLKEATENSQTLET